MNSNAILSSDVLDLLFENRNKKYGAYILRKFYPNRLKTSLYMMLGMAAILSAFTFLPEKKITGNKPDIFGGPVFREITIEKTPEAPKPTQQKIVTPPVQKLTSSFNIVANTDSSDVLNEITDQQIGLVTNNTDITGGPVDIGPAIAGSGSGNEIEKPAETEINTNIPVEDPDVQATFPGGEAALVNFLQKNLRAPDEMEAGGSVQVKIKFVVGFEGNLQAFAVQQDGGVVFNNEVIRVLKKMPRWNPGKKGGRNVPVYYSLPVKFAAAE
jgi:protein TonB